MQPTKNLKSKNPYSIFPPFNTKKNVENVTFSCINLINISKNVSGNIFPDHILHGFENRKWKMTEKGQTEHTLNLQKKGAPK